MKTLKIIIYLITCSGLLHSQTKDLKNSEDELILAFENYREADYYTRYDSLRPKLRTQIEDVLADPKAFDYPFDALSKHITIIRSKDQNLRLFSWDELTGGTWHDMAVIAQFKTKNEAVKVKWIDADRSEAPEGVTDAIQYEIHDVSINEKNHYLCFGWGTYGAGHHHKSILIFTIEDDTLTLCESCISKDYSIIQAPRGAEIKVTYNENVQEISFPEFKYDESHGFFDATGATITLKLRNGKFEND